MYSGGIEHSDANSISTSRKYYKPLAYVEETAPSESEISPTTPIVTVKLDETFSSPIPSASKSVVSIEKHVRAASQLSKKSRHTKSRGSPVPPSTIHKPAPVKRKVESKGTVELPTAKSPEPKNTTDSKTLHTRLPTDKSAASAYTYDFE